MSMDSPTRASPPTVGTVDGVKQHVLTLLEGGQTLSGGDRKGIGTLSGNLACQHADPFSLPDLTHADPRRYEAASTSFTEWVGRAAQVEALHATAAACAVAPRSRWTWTHRSDTSVPGRVRTAALTAAGLRELAGQGREWAPAVKNAIAQMMSPRTAACSLPRPELRGCGSLLQATRLAARLHRRRPPQHNRHHPNTPGSGRCYCSATGKITRLTTPSLITTNLHLSRAVG